MIKYLTFAISIAFISWIVGMLISAMLSKTSFITKNMSQLNFIRSEKLNNVIGLNYFKWIIIHSFFKFFNPKLSMKKRILPRELEDYRAEMTAAEVNHIFAFAFMLIFVLINVFKGLYLSAWIIMLVNIIMNLYPALLQQQNKRRIDKYLAILKRRADWPINV